MIKALLICGIIIFLYAIKVLSLKKMLFMAVYGATSFFAAEVLLYFAGYTLPVNIYTVMISVVGGFPGTVFNSAVVLLF